MTAVLKRWEVLPRVPAEHLANFPDLPPLVVQLLYNRHIRAADEVSAFLARSSADDNPFQMRGMNEAVARLRRAIRAGERIAVYGDYDVDGVTATALLVPTLQALGAQAEPYIPKRLVEGYGLNKPALEELARKGVRIVVTVDCGVRSVDEAAFAQELGLDMVITDHHTAAAQLPPAVAIIDPKRKDERYPFRHLAGVGLAYKLAQGLLRAERQVPIQKNALLPDEDDLLDLVALGTVADLAPLLGENRALVSRGLQKLNEARRPGIGAMLEEAALKPGQVDARTIGYVLGPRLNASGRLDDAMASYNLLVTSYPDEARALARQLGTTNQERQRLMKEMVEHARQEVAALGDARIYILASPTYASGIAGLIASRITEEFYRPTLVIAIGENESRGSARSVEGFHITEALDACRVLLVRHGGHRAAAGFTVKNELIPDLRAKMEEIAAQQIADRQLQPLITVDMELPLCQANAETLGLLESLQPFGAENQRPLFVSNNVRVCESRAVGSDQKTLRLRLANGGVKCEAVAFRQDVRAQDVPERIDVVYALQSNEWNGRVSTELMVKDWRPAATS